MLQLALSDYPNLLPSDVEFNLPQPNYTINTIETICENYPQHLFQILIGSDNLQRLADWYRFSELIQKVSFLVYPRKGTDHIAPTAQTEVTKISAPIIEISSTSIRTAIKNRQQFKTLIPLKTYKYIKENKLYLDR